MNFGRASTILRRLPYEYGEYVLTEVVLPMNHPNFKIIIKDKLEFANMMEYGISYNIYDIGTLQKFGISEYRNKIIQWIVQKSDIRFLNNLKANNYVINSTILNKTLTKFGSIEVAQWCKDNGISRQLSKGCIANLVKYENLLQWMNDNDYKINCVHNSKCNKKKYKGLVSYSSQHISRIVMKTIAECNKGHLINWFKTNKLGIDFVRYYLEPDIVYSAINIALKNDSQNVLNKMKEEIKTTNYGTLFAKYVRNNNDSPRILEWYNTMKKSKIIAPLNEHI
jgi:hypothetical protein